MYQLAILPQADNIVPFPQKSNEWYTPSRYIEAARAVMGSIDLDPASCELANRTVKATRFYTAKENGLAQEWSGNVWLNPPYSLANNKGEGGLFKSNIEGFTDKLVTEYQSGNVKQAVLLALAKIDSRWFQSLWDYLICFSGYSVKFDGVKSNPKNSLKHMFGTVFVYLGPHEQKFISTFEQFGTVARRVSQPKRAVTPLSLWGDVCR